MSRRDQIVMTQEEIDAFLRGARTVIVSSIGKGGVPHPAPMWFAVEDDGSLVMSTFTKSQKIQNLKRDPRVSLLVEDGTRYAELRGVIIYGVAELHRDTDIVMQVMREISVQAGEVDRRALTEAEEAGMRAQAEKRTAIRVRPQKLVSWDHRRLGGVY